MDEMLGKLDENGNVTEWPKFNVMGAEYVPPSSRVNVSASSFVVIPAGFTQWELLEPFKSGGKPARRVKAGEGES